MEIPWILDRLIILNIKKWKQNPYENSGIDKILIHDEQNDRCAIIF